MAVDMVNHPPHYQQEDPAYEPIKVILAWTLPFTTGNTVKYIARAGRKADYVEDLEKAGWYLDKEIEVVRDGMQLSPRVVDEHGKFHREVVMVLQDALEGIGYGLDHHELQDLLASMARVGLVVMRADDVT